MPSRSASFDGLDQAGAVGLAHGDAVDHQREVVLLLLVELRRGLELVHRAVDLDAHEPATAQVVEHLAELALAVARQRREHEQLLPGLLGDQIAHDLGGAPRSCTGLPQVGQRCTPARA